MADTHEEQLLSELLSDIAHEDARLDAAHLESRVMAEVDASSTVRLKPDTTYFVVAAAVAIAVFAPALDWMSSSVAPPAAGSKVAATEEVIAEKPAVVVPRQPAPVRRVRQQADPAGQPSAPSPIARSPVAEPPIAQSPITQSLDEFLPLMPITEQELTGSFQIVRVQMPRASLGALRLPLEHPNELVEADVLLGEDGMARAIRVSTSGSVYPWRSR